MPTVHLQVKGKVQGVFYRASARDKAISLGLVGWVRNMPSGWVEAMATGNEEQIKEFTEWCREGPAGARVEEIVVQSITEISFEGFQIIRGL